MDPCSGPYNPQNTPFSSALLHSLLSGGKPLADTSLVQAARSCSRRIPKPEPNSFWPCWLVPFTSAPNAGKRLMRHAGHVLASNYHAALHRDQQAPPAAHLPREYGEHRQEVTQGAGRAYSKSLRLRVRIQYTYSVPRILTSRILDSPLIPKGRRTQIMEL